MALTSQQIADILFKKVATGKADSGSLPFAFFEESINANKSTITKDYWVDAALIPDVNPLTSGTHGQTLGVVQAMKTLLLDWIPGTFAFTHPSLKDVIPFNYGNGSYNYQLLTNNGTTVIPAGTNDWYLDTEGGVLTFFNGGTPAFPTGVNSTTLRPKLTCWTYVGAKNNPVLTLTESSAGAVADTYVLNSDLRFYSPNIVYVVKVATDNTGASTININSLGAKSIKKNDDGNLVDVEADDIKSGVNYILVYDSLNDIFQVASGAGGSGNASLKIVDITSTDWVLNSGVYEYTIPNYTILGFKEVGSVGLWTQISGNDFELVTADFEINRFTKELVIKSLTNPVAQLRIMGGGKVDLTNSSSGASGYLNDLTDVVTNNSTTGDILTYDGTNWVNTQMNTSLDDLSDITINSLNIGDTLSYDGTNWVNIQTDNSLNGLSDVVSNSSTNGDLLTYDGTNWVNINGSNFVNSYVDHNSVLIKEQLYDGSNGNSSYIKKATMLTIDFKPPSFNLIGSTSDIYTKASAWDYYYGSGYAWFGTKNGLNLFNNSVITTYKYPTTTGFGNSSSSNIVNDILLFGYPNLIASTNDGAISWDRNTNTFSNLNITVAPSKVFNESTYDPSNSNILYFASNDGMVSYNTSTTTQNLFSYPTTTGFGTSGHTSNYLLSISLDSYDNSILAMTGDNSSGNGGYLVKNTSNVFTTYCYPLTSGFGISNNSNYVNSKRSITTTPSNLTWIGTKDGLIKYDRASNTFTTYSYPLTTGFGNSSLSNNITSVLYNSGTGNNTVYLGTKSGEMILVNYSTMTFTTLTFPGITEIIDCTFDGGYVSIVGVGGVVKLSTVDNSYTVYTIPSTPTCVIGVLSLYPNSTIVGTINGLYKLDNKISGILSLKNSTSGTNISIDISTNTPNISNDSFNYTTDYLSAISTYINTNLSTDYSAYVKNSKYLIILRKSPLEGTIVSSDEVVKIWTDNNLSNTSLTKYVNFGNNYSNNNFITLPVSEPTSSNFGFSRNAKPLDAPVVRFEPETYYYDTLNDVWTHIVIPVIPDVSNFITRPSSYTSNNLLVINNGTSGTNSLLVDSGINTSLFNQKYKNISFVDYAIGNDSTGLKGAILKPFKTISQAVGGSSSGDLVFLMPGDHQLPNTGIDIRDGVDFYLLNANLLTNAGNPGIYGANTPNSSATFKIFGKGAFKRGSGSSSGMAAMITPYMQGLNIEIDGIDFICGNYPFIGTNGEIVDNTTNGTGGYLYNKIISIKNSFISSTNNIVPTSSYPNIASTNAKITLENCYFKGLLTVAIGNANPGFAGTIVVDRHYNYGFKAKNTTFEAVSNSNGVNSNVMFLDFYDSTFSYKSIFYNCTFLSSHENVKIGVGSSGSIGGTNKQLYFYDCKFVNGSEGWLINNATGSTYKLINNWSTNSNTGTQTVTNLLSGSGITIDSGLELL